MATRTNSRTLSLKDPSNHPSTHRSKAERMGVIHASSHTPGNAPSPTNTLLKLNDFLQTHASDTIAGRRISIPLHEQGSLPQELYTTISPSASTQAKLNGVRRLSTSEGVNGKQQPQPRSMDGSQSNEDRSNSITTTIATGADEIFFKSLRNAEEQRQQREAKVGHFASITLSVNTKLNAIYQSLSAEMREQITINRLQLEKAERQKQSLAAVFTIRHKHDEDLLNALVAKFHVDTKKGAMSRLLAAEHGPTKAERELHKAKERSRKEQEDKRRLRSQRIIRGEDVSDEDGDAMSNSPDLLFAKLLQAKPDDSAVPEVEGVHGRSGYPSPHQALTTGRSRSQSEGPLIILNKSTSHDTAAAAASLLGRNGLATSRLSRAESQHQSEVSRSPSRYVSGGSPPSIVQTLGPHGGATTKHQTGSNAAQSNNTFKFDSAKAIATEIGSLVLSTTAARDQRIQELRNVIAERKREALMAKEEAQLDKDAMERGVDLNLLKDIKVAFEMTVDQYRHCKGVVASKMSEEEYRRSNRLYLMTNREVAGAGDSNRSGDLLPTGIRASFSGFDQPLAPPVALIGSSPGVIDAATAFQRVFITHGSESKGTQGPLMRVYDDEGNATFVPKPQAISNASFSSKKDSNEQTLAPHDELTLGTPKSFMPKPLRPSELNEIRRKEIEAEQQRKTNVGSEKSLAGVDEDEFLFLFGQSLCRGMEDEEIRHWFRTIDRDCSGSIQWNEISHYLITTEGDAIKQANKHAASYFVEETVENLTSGGGGGPGGIKPHDPSSASQQHNGKLTDVHAPTSTQAIGTDNTITNKATRKVSDYDTSNHFLVGAAASNDRKHRSSINQLVHSTTMDRIFSRATNDELVMAWDPIRLNGMSVHKAPDNLRITDLAYLPHNEKLMILQSDRSVFIYDAIKFRGQPVLQLDRIFATDGRNTRVSAHHVSHYSPLEMGDGSVKAGRGGSGGGPMRNKHHNRSGMAIGGSGLSGGEYSSACAAVFEKSLDGFMCFDHLGGGPNSSIEPVVFGTESGTIEVYHLAASGLHTGFAPLRAKVAYRSHTQPITKIFYAPELEGVITSSLDGSVAVTDISTGAVMQRMTLEDNPRPVFDFEYTRNHNTLVTWGGRRLHMWNAMTGSRLVTLEEHDAPIEAVSINSQMMHLYVIQANKVVKIWDMRAWKAIGQVEDRLQRYPTNTLGSALWLQDHQLLYTGSSDLFAWRPSEVQERMDAGLPPAQGAFLGNILAIKDMKVLPDAGHTVTIDAQNVIVWSSATKKLLSTWRWASIDDAATSISWSPDGVRMLVGTEHGSLSWYNYTNGVQFFDFMLDEPSLNDLIPESLQCRYHVSRTTGTVVLKRKAHKSIYDDRRITEAQQRREDLGKVKQQQQTAGGKRKNNLADDLKSSDVTAGALAAGNKGKDKAGGDMANAAVKTVVCTLILTTLDPNVLVIIAGVQNCLYAWMDITNGDQNYLPTSKYEHNPDENVLSVCECDSERQLIASSWAPHTILIMSYTLAPLMAFDTRLPAEKLFFVTPCLFAGATPDGCLRFYLIHETMYDTRMLCCFQASVTDEEPVTCVAFERTSGRMVVGDASGAVSVFKMPSLLSPSHVKNTVIPALFSLGADASVEDVEQLYDAVGTIELEVAIDAHEGAVNAAHLETGEPEESGGNKASDRGNSNSNNSNSAFASSTINGFRKEKLYTSGGDRFLRVWELRAVTQVDEFGSRYADQNHVPVVFRQRKLGLRRRETEASIEATHRREEREQKKSDREKRSRRGTAMSVDAMASGSQDSEDRYWHTKPIPAEDEPLDFLQKCRQQEDQLQGDDWIQLDDTTAEVVVLYDPNLTDQHDFHDQGVSIYGDERVLTKRTTKALTFSTAGADGSPAIAEVRHSTAKAEVVASTAAIGLKEEKAIKDVAKSGSPADKTKTRTRSGSTKANASVTDSSASPVPTKKRRKKGADDSENSFSETQTSLARSFTKHSIQAVAKLVLQQQQQQRERRESAEPSTGDAALSPTKQSKQLLASPSPHPHLLSGYRSPLEGSMMAASIMGGPPVGATFSRSPSQHRLTAPGLLSPSTATFQASASASVGAAVTSPPASALGLLSPLVPHQGLQRETSDLSASVIGRSTPSPQPQHQSRQTNSNSSNNLLLAASANNKSIASKNIKKDPDGMGESIRSAVSIAKLRRGQSIAANAAYQAAKKSSPNQGPKRGMSLFGTSATSALFAHSQASNKEDGADNDSSSQARRRSRSPSGAPLSVGFGFEVKGTGGRNTTIPNVSFSDFVVIGSDSIISSNEHISSAPPPLNTTGKFIISPMIEAQPDPGQKDHGHHRGGIKNVSFGSAIPNSDAQSSPRSGGSEPSVTPHFLPTIAQLSLSESNPTIVEAPNNNATSQKQPLFSISASPNNSSSLKQPLSGDLPPAAAPAHLSAHVAEIMIQVSTDADSPRRFMNTNVSGPAHGATATGRSSTDSSHKLLGNNNFLDLLGGGGANVVSMVFEASQDGDVEDGLEGAEEDADEIRSDSMWSGMIGEGEAVRQTSGGSDDGAIASALSEALRMARGSGSAPKEAPPLSVFSPTAPNPFPQDLPQDRLNSPPMLRDVPTRPGSSSFPVASQRRLGSAGGSGAAGGRVGSAGAVPTVRVPTPSSDASLMRGKRADATSAVAAGGRPPLPFTSPLPQVQPTLLSPMSLAADSETLNIIPLGRGYSKLKLLEEQDLVFAQPNFGSGALGHEFNGPATRRPSLPESLDSDGQASTDPLVAQSSVPRRRRQRSIAVTIDDTSDAGTPRRTTTKKPDSQNDNDHDHYDSDYTFGTQAPSPLNRSKRSPSIVMSGPIRDARKGGARAKVGAGDPTKRALAVIRNPLMAKMPTAEDLLKHHKIGPRLSMSTSNNPPGSNDTIESTSASSPSYVADGKTAPQTVGTSDEGGSPRGLQRSRSNKLLDAKRLQKEEDERRQRLAEQEGTSEDDGSFTPLGFALQAEGSHSNKLGSCLLNKKRAEGADRKSVALLDISTRSTESNKSNSPSKKQTGQQNVGGGSQRSSVAGSPTVPLFPQQPQVLFFGNASGAQQGMGGVKKAKQSERDAIGLNFWSDTRPAEADDLPRMMRKAAVERRNYKLMAGFGRPTPKKVLEEEDEERRRSLLPIEGAVSSNSNPLALTVQRRRRKGLQPAPRFTNVRDHELAVANALDGGGTAHNQAPTAPSVDALDANFNFLQLGTSPSRRGSAPALDEDGTSRLPLPASVIASPAAALFSQIRNARAKKELDDRDLKGRMTALKPTCELLDNLASGGLVLPSIRMNEAGTSGVAKSKMLVRKPEAFPAIQQSGVAEGIESTRPSLSQGFSESISNNLRNKSVAISSTALPPIHGGGAPIKGTATSFAHLYEVSDDEGIGGDPNTRKAHVEALHSQFMASRPLATLIASTAKEANKTGLISSPSAYLSASLLQSNSANASPASIVAQSSVASSSLPVARRHTVTNLSAVMKSLMLNRSGGLRRASNTSSSKDDNGIGSGNMADGGAVKPTQSGLGSVPNLNVSVTNMQQGKRKADRAKLRKERHADDATINEIFAGGVQSEADDQPKPLSVLLSDVNKSRDDDGSAEEDTSHIKAMAEMSWEERSEVRAKTLKAALERDAKMLATATSRTVRLRPQLAAIKAPSAQESAVQVLLLEVGQIKAAREAKETKAQPVTANPLVKKNNVPASSRNKNDVEVVAVANDASRPYSQLPLRVYNHSSAPKEISSLLKRSKRDGSSERNHDDGDEDGGKVGGGLNHPQAPLTFAGRYLAGTAAIGSLLTGGPSVPKAVSVAHEKRKEPKDDLFGYESN